MTSATTKSFRILHTVDAHKKRKIYHDGILTVKKNCGGDQIVAVSLTSIDGAILKRCNEKTKLFDEISVGDEISIGHFSVQIEEILVEQQDDTSLPNPINSSKFWENAKMSSKMSARSQSKDKETCRAPQLISSSALKMGKFKVPSNTNDSGTSKTSVGNTSLPIELDASITKRMRKHQIDGANFILSKLTNGEQKYLSTNTSIYGVILADEMGLGKTLTTISVIWAFVRSCTCKCLIVCPSSLCKNWQKEILKWLGTRMHPICVQSSDGPEAAKSKINSFSCGHIKGIAPALIISYEMFLRHATLLNTVNDLNMLVCDEGHRLKKAEGSQTIKALCACKAKLRLVLTGTPVQNNLDELFALVSFVAPGYLGSSSEFNARFTIPIQRGCEPRASVEDRDIGAEASALLREKLSSILLRRAQKDILSNILPPRTDFVIFCRMTTIQSEQYEQIAEKIRRLIGDGGEGNDEEAVEVNDEVCGRGSLLPLLSSLRQICNNCDPPKSNIIHSNPLSAKLQILEIFVSQLRRLHPTEKLVVVATFTTALDMVESLAKKAGWGPSFRLDGKVAVQKRQPLIDSFNSPSDKTFLFLLSCKAGGVGINLIGASRLIMFDVDWNPASDKQAMSRVWRDGQKRPVFVYRLVCHGTIEDAMLQRQNSKEDLAMALQSNEQENIDRNIQMEGLTDERMCARRQSLTKQDVLLLLDPNTKFEECNHMGKQQACKTNTNRAKRSFIVESDEDDENEEEGSDPENYESHFLEGETEVGGVGLESRTLEDVDELENLIQIDDVLAATFQQIRNQIVKLERVSQR